jgi:hypothetical protein
MKIRTSSLLSLTTIAVTALVFAASCKKSSAEPSSRLSVSINGTAFSPTQVSAFDYQGYIEVMGYKVAGADSSAVYIQLDDTTSLNKALDVSGGNDAQIIWTDKSVLYDSWNYLSHGALTLTAFDKTNKKVSGTFTGVLYESSGQDSVRVTDGQFDAAYITP